MVDEIVALGIGDVIDVKYYENRQNGQSKGFALVSFNSEISVRQCMERLPNRQIHSQTPVVLPYTKHSLAQFEAATRKPGERPPNQPQSKPAVSMLEPNNKQGTPMFIGTFRIGTNPAPQPQAPMLRPGPVVIRNVQPMPPGMPPPSHMPPRGPPPVVIPPPAPSRPPPAFPPHHHMRHGAPPPIPGNN